MLNKQALIDEPNAAFLSYISDFELKQQITILEDYPTNILVFDFGAGTCDISIIEVGYNIKGFYSKNLSISRFEAVGGDDIDKVIAQKILLPQFLKNNNLKESFFKTKEIENYIIPRLQKSAELLKISISKELLLRLDRNELNQLLEKDSSISLHNTITIKSRKGIFSLPKPTLSYKEFFKINESFTSHDFKNNKSIYSPISSALTKAHLEKDDIDYLLFIGGSAKNPLVQKSLEKYFNTSEYLIPKDLQAHVSAGAAIHSMIFNGFNKNIIDPITNEPILAIIKDGEQETIQTLLPAGMNIPSKTVHIKNLKPQKDTQETIEVPICVGNKNKILHIIKIENNEKKHFTKNSDIELTISVMADKMLHITMILDGKVTDVEPLNPFTNLEVTLRDREVFKAEKEFNKEIVSNYGELTQYALQRLYNKYRDLGLELKAAETGEQLYELFDTANLNNIGLHYSNAGLHEKAMKFYQKAMNDSPSATTAFNIAHQYKYNNKTLYKQWLEKALEIDPTDNNSLYSYGVLLVDENNQDKGYQKIRKAFNSWKKEYEQGYLSSHISWFIACANYLEEYSYAMELESSNKNRDESNEPYNGENLISLKYNYQLEEV